MNQNNQFFPGPENATFAQMMEDGASTTKPTQTKRRAFFASMFGILFAVLIACICFWAGWIAQQELNDMEEEILNDVPKAYDTSDMDKDEMEETDGMASDGDVWNFDEQECGLSFALVAQDSYEGVDYDTFIANGGNVEEEELQWVYTKEIDGTITIHYVPGRLQGFPSEAGALGDTVFSVSCEDTTLTLDEAYIARKAEVDALEGGSYGEPVSLEVAGLDAYRSSFENLISIDTEVLLVNEDKLVRISIFGEKDETLIADFLENITVI